MSVTKTSKLSICDVRSIYAVAVHCRNVSEANALANHVNILQRMKAMKLRRYVNITLR